MSAKAASFDAVVVGNAGIDTNIYLQGADIDFTIEANFSQNVDYVGQAGGYTSRGYARLGYRTAFIGSVGADHNGEFLLREFAGDGIDTSAVFFDPAGTARSVNLMYQDGRRKNFYDGRGHMALQADIEAARRILPGAKLAHFHLPNWARSLLPEARAAGAFVVCDIQDVVDVDDPYRDDFVQHADMLFFSTVNHADPQPLIERYLRRMAGDVVVVGMGAAGCAVGTADGILYFPPVEVDWPVIDTNGAGDGLAVGFLAAYLFHQKPIAEAALWGQIVARYTCMQRASTSELITMEQLREQLELA